jgi:signal transduction histidine kinase
VDAELSVLACQPSAAAEDQALTACIESRQLLGDPAASAPAGDAVVVAPLTAALPGSGADARVDGVLAVKLSSAGRRLTEDDHGLLAGVASHVAVAIANQRLTERERNRLRSYAMQVTQAQEDERKRIARELHDEASQNLVVIRRGLTALGASVGDHPAAAQLSELRDLAGQTVAGLRRFSRDLRPPTLDALGVSSALDQLVTQVHERSGLAADFCVEGPYRRLPIETELAVFRIGQEALHNVERHGAASSVAVDLTFEHGRVRLKVTDDGCGFQPPQNLEELPESGKLGLIGMRERAQLVGGTLQLHSRPGTGTRVELEVPG